MRFVRIFRYDPIKDPTARLRLDYDPVYGNAILADENVHPEQAENPDCNHIEELCSMQLTTAEIRWLYDELAYLVVAMEQADAETNARVEALRNGQHP